MHLAMQLTQKDHVEYIVAGFGVLVAAIQSLGLFILSDIRKRITRLEDHVMEQAK